MCIAGVLFYLYISNEDGGYNKLISYTEFKEMVSKGYADKITAYNDNTVDMVIKPQFVKEVFKDKANKVGRSPSVHVEVGSIESLDKFLETAQEEGKFSGEISYEKKSDMFSTIFWNIAPIFIIIAIWIFIMRRMSGGGGAQGGVFNVGKSKAKLFIKS